MEVGPLAQDILGATTEEVGLAFMPNGHSGVAASSATGGVAEVAPQTSNQRLSTRLQTSGGLQLEELAQTTQHRLPDPESVVAAEAEIQAVAIPEQGLFGAAVTSRAGASVAGAAATAVRSGNAEVGGFVTPQNSRPMRPAEDEGEVNGALPVGLRWLGRIGHFSELAQEMDCPFRCGRVRFLLQRDRQRRVEHLKHLCLDRKLHGNYRWFRIGLHCLSVPLNRNQTPSSSSLSAEAIQAEVRACSTFGAAESTAAASPAPERRLLPQPTPAAASVPQLLPQPKQSAASEGRLLPGVPM